jgi:hypothetical protein
MNDKTNLLGYSTESIGTSLSNASTTLTTNCNGTVNTYPDGNWPMPLTVVASGLNYSNGSDYTSLSQAIANSNNMNRQTKVAVFTVERNEDNKVVSSKFVKEFWVEIKNGGSVELAAAKQLDKDYDPDTTIIREIHICNF